MFGNQKGNQLFGGGDGLWSSKTGSWERIQTCYLNAIEFEHMIKIIHLFHDFKNKNKISAL
jgi:hypothetical protein